MARMFTAGLIISGVLVLGAGQALAQAPRPPAPSGQDEPPRVQGGVGVFVAQPVGDLGVHVDDAGGGLFHLDARLGKSVFSLGGEIAGLFYGSESRKVDVSSLVPDIPDPSLKVITDNTKGAIRREGGTAILDFSRPTTDMVTIYIGVAFGR